MKTMNVLATFVLAVGLFVTGCSVGMEKTDGVRTVRKSIRLGWDANISILSGGGRTTVVNAPTYIGTTAVQRPSAVEPQPATSKVPVVIPPSFGGEFYTREPVSVSPVIVAPVTPVLVQPISVIQPPPRIISGEVYSYYADRPITVGVMFYGGGVGFYGSGGFSVGWGWPQYYYGPNVRNERMFYDNARHTYGVSDGHGTDSHPGGGRYGPGPGLPGSSHGGRGR